ncbi:acyl-CoA thioesterase [Desulfovibrionales bacterium]
MKRFPYFKTPGQCIDGKLPPLPIAHSVQRIVRFEEVDPLAIVWHGRYPSYFEDARVAFGNFYGVGYGEMRHAGIVAPIKNMYLDYIAPLTFGEMCTITAWLHWSESARINFAYTITNERQQIVTTGYTVQLFVNAQGELLMEQPAFFATFCEQWKSGAFA